MIHFYRNMAWPFCIGLNVRSRHFVEITEKSTFSQWVLKYFVLDCQKVLEWALETSIGSYIMV